MVRSLEPEKVGDSDSRSPFGFLNEIGELVDASIAEAEAEERAKLEAAKADFKAKQRLDLMMAEFIRDTQVKSKGCIRAKVSHGDAFTFTLTWQQGNTPSRSLEVSNGWDAVKWRLTNDREWSQVRPAEFDFEMLAEPLRKLATHRLWKEQPSSGRPMIVVAKRVAAK